MSNWRNWTCPGVQLVSNQEITSSVLRHRLTEEEVRSWAVNFSRIVLLNRPTFDLAKIICYKLVYVASNATSSFITGGEIGWSGRFPSSGGSVPRRKKNAFQSSRIRKSSVRLFSRRLCCEDALKSSGYIMDLYMTYNTQAGEAKQCVGGHIQGTVQRAHIVISPGAVPKQNQTVGEDLVLQRP